MSTFTPAHSPFEEENPAFADVREAAALASSGQRLDRTAAEALYYKASLHTLAQLAHGMRLRMHPEPIVTYVGDRNINYSNVCVCACRFCAFFRAPDQDGGYIISREEMAQKIEDFNLTAAKSNDTPVFRQMTDDLLMKLLESGRIPLEIFLNNCSLPGADKLLAEVKSFKDRKSVV